MELTGAQALIKSLEMCDVEVMFGLPGGAILPVYDPILDSKIRHVLVRHEQGAGHMAQGYAHVTGKPGVAIVTSGPAATNIVTPLCDAYMDSIPMVAITGQVALGSIGSDAFQECDTTGITRPCTKHNYLVKDVNNLSSVFHEAFEIALPLISLEAQHPNFIATEYSKAACLFVAVGIGTFAAYEIFFFPSYLNSADDISKKKIITSEALLCCAISRKFIRLFHIQEVSAD